MARAKPPLSLKGRALALLAQREHSEAELRRKLRRHAGDAAADADSEAIAARLDALIAWLREHRYLSEERFVESRVHARAARYGNLRIRQELAQHGVQLGGDAAQALKDTELQRAMAVWQRKFAHPAVDAHDKARQSRFLAQRGFSAETIARVLRDAGRADVAQDLTADPPPQGD